MTLPSESSFFYIGIDAGATKTLIWAATPEDSKTVQISLEGVNLYRTPLSEAHRILFEGIQQVCRVFGDYKLGGICAGIAGASHLANRNALTASLEESLVQEFEAPILVINDTDIAFEGAFGNQTGILAITGTGSNVLARDKKRQLISVGGWGYLLGDEGSGMAISLEALRSIAIDFDEDRTSILRTQLETHFGISTRTQLLGEVYRNNWQVQKFAPFVIESAAAGDTVSEHIISDQALALSNQIFCLSKKVPEIKKQLAFIGGLYKHNYYQNILHKAVWHLLPNWEIVSSKHSPAMGAWQLAKRLNTNF